MPRVSDIINTIESVYPKNLAMSWDNPGLICGHFDKEVNNVLIALDADAKTADKAVKLNADMIITHHPMIFGSIKHVNDSDAVGRKLLSLIENNIACYAMHTNFDIADDGMCAAVAEKLGIDAIKPLEQTTAINDKALGIGFIGELPEETGVRELAENVKKLFGLSSCWIYDAGKKVKRIAVCPGSGKGMLNEVKEQGAQVFITGDTGHHDGLDYIDEGISLIDAGHFGLEHVFADKISCFIRENFSDVTVYTEVYDERQFI